MRPPIITSHLGESFLEIAHKIFLVFDTDGETNQAIRDSTLEPVLARYHHVRGGGGVADEALHLDGGTADTNRRHRERDDDDDCYL